MKRPKIMTLSPRSPPPANKIWEVGNKPRTEASSVTIPWEDTSVMEIKMVKMKTTIELDGLMTCNEDESEIKKL